MHHSAANKYSKCQSEHNVLDWHAAAVVELTLEHNAAMWVSQVWLLQPASSQQTSVTSGTNGLLHQAANSCVSQNWDSSVWKQWQARCQEAYQHIQPASVEVASASQSLKVTVHFSNYTLLFTLRAFIFKLYTCSVCNGTSQLNSLL